MYKVKDVDVINKINLVFTFTNYYYYYYVI